jgi:hypothetical protein
MNAGVRLDRKLAGGRKAELTRLRMNGVHRAHIQAGQTFRPAARFRNDVGQLLLPQAAAPQRSSPPFRDGSWAGAFLQFACKSRLTDSATECQVVFGAFGSERPALPGAAPGSRNKGQILGAEGGVVPGKPIRGAVPATRSASGSQPLAATHAIYLRSGRTLTSLKSSVELPSWFCKPM